eukprot:Nk52_evm34s151 gene=Nk52_evmTU34s151
MSEQDREGGGCMDKKGEGCCGGGSCGGGADVVLNHVQPRVQAPALSEEGAEEYDVFFGEASEGQGEGGGGDREWELLKREHYTRGYVEGIEAGKEQGTQKGFDAGYGPGCRYGYSFGYLRGVLAVCAATGGAMTGASASPCPSSSSSAAILDELRDILKELNEISNEEMIEKSGIGEKISEGGILLAKGDSEEEDVNPSGGIDFDAVERVLEDSDAVENHSALAARACEAIHCMGMGQLLHKAPRIPLSFSAK